MNTAPVQDELNGAGQEVRDLLRSASQVLSSSGAPPLGARGGLIRPLLVLAGCTEHAGAPAGFAAAAVQYAHEASLLHDDVLDGARMRRGQPTVQARAGVTSALVQGDHLLTASYCAAAQTGSMEFVRAFARAVERTVAGEREQAARVGEVLDAAEYRAIVGDKSGELLGCALAAEALLRGAEAEAARLYDLGRRLGVFYQMVDDLLDYIPAAQTGKEALLDYAQRKWTWPLARLGTRDFQADSQRVVAALLRPHAGVSILQECQAQLEREATHLLAHVDELVPRAGLVRALVHNWLQQAGRNIVAARARYRHQLQDEARAWLRAQAPDANTWAEYFATNSRTFRLGARFFQPERARLIASIYAFCRFTDDLVDAQTERPDPALLLDEWEQLSFQAYVGLPTGCTLLDTVMSDMAINEVPFLYLSELIEGMRMDLRGRRYGSLAELRVYTHRVAGVIGQWLTERCGVRDVWVLEQAARLGHAMQLTNIVRDVVEDWRRGRLYLPRDLLDQHGVRDSDLMRVAEHGIISNGYRALLEQLMEIADQEYQAAFTALHRLPADMARAVAAAARVYQGIHREIRRLHFDGRRRASTSPARRLLLAARGLHELAWLRQTRRWVQA